MTFKYLIVIVTNNTFISSSTFRLRFKENSGQILISTAEKIYRRLSNTQKYLLMKFGSILAIFFNVNIFSVMITLSGMANKSTKRKSEIFRAFSEWKSTKSAVSWDTKKLWRCRNPKHFSFKSNSSWRKSVVF